MFPPQPSTTCEGLKFLEETIREELSNVTQTPAPTVNNGVLVSLDEKSVWTVTGDSYITSLTLAEGAVVTAPSGKKLAVTVDGQPAQLRLAPSPERSILPWYNPNLAASSCNSPPVGCGSRGAVFIRSAGT